MSRGLACALATIAAFAQAAGVPPGDAVLLDPFAQATRGLVGCPEVAPPYVSPERMRIIAHERAERGTTCALEGRCEPGGAYRRDPEINERVRAALASERRFADTSVWITTTRKFVTLQGCVRTKAERRALVAFVRAQPGVERVLDELTVGPARKAAAAGR
ncbi:MAG TPA: BON domain-containing protein [Casimicrobiaceae bacterium]|nr:BON domain-containing protein [Casimicrobiaceae bacterium]